jgi:plastocyanin
MKPKFIYGTLLATALMLGGAQAMTDPNAVTIKNFSFGKPITVTAGSTVTWQNSDGEPHTIFSVDGLFRSAALDTGETFKFKFTKKGTFKYTCTIHPRMVSTVTVK